MNSYSDILNNELIINSLKAAVKNGCVNHAYIFDGEKGIGKTSLAKAFAKTLNCEKGGEEACGECTSCRTFDDGNNPDIFYIENEKGIKVDDVRLKINSQIMTRPYTNRFKIFIIKDADMMNVQAQNAFLKTLEEPPEFVKFLLLSTNFNRFLVTILSRCVLFKLRPLSQPQLCALLIKKGFTPYEADTAAHYSNGVVGRALELHGSEEFENLSRFALDLCVRMKSLDLIDMYKETDALKDKKDQFDTLLQLMYYIFRDALVYKVTSDPDRLIHSAHLSEIQKICADFSQRRLTKACDAIEYARRRRAANGNFQFTAEELFYSIKEK